MFRFVCEICAIALFYFLFFPQTHSLTLSFLGVVSLLLLWIALGPFGWPFSYNVSFHHIRSPPLSHTHKFQLSLRGVVALISRFRFVLFTLKILKESWDQSKAKKGWQILKGRKWKGEEKDGENMQFHLFFLLGICIRKAKKSKNMMATLNKHVISRYPKSISSSSGDRLA